jgi:ferritin-like metal-binding protein YciE
MFERLTTPEEIFNFKVGATLKMEQTILEILDDSIGSGQDEQVRELLQEHRSESEQHVRVVEEAFGLLGTAVDDSPCPAIEGLQKEAKANVKMTDDDLVDSVILQGALEVEYHEIAVYENLLIGANAIDRDDVMRLLHGNFESEESARDKVRQLLAEIMAGTPSRQA